MKKLIFLAILLSVMSCTSETDKLRVNLENCETEKAELANKVTEYKGKISDLEDQVSNLESELDDCETKFKRCKRDLNDLEFEEQTNQLDQ